MVEKRRATTFRTSRGAIVNVQYPDIYIAPSIAPVDVTNPAEMREELLRKEAIHGYVSRILMPSDKDSDLACVYPITNDDVVYTNGFAAVPHVARRDLLSGAESWRITGYTGIYGLDYDDVNDRILFSDANGIYIVKASDGSILQNITYFTDLGGVVRSLAGLLVFEAVWDPTNLDRIFFVARFGACAVHLNIKTLNAVAMFGTWLINGTDLTHLTAPSGIDVNPPEDDVYIVDQINHRILRLKLSDFSTVQDLMLVPFPISIRKARWGVQNTQRRYPTIVSSWSGSITWPIMYTFGSHRSRGLLFSMPLQMEWPRWSPDYTRFWGADIFGREVDFRRVMGKFESKNDSATLLNNEAVADAGWYSPPIPGALLGEVSLNLYSSQAGTLYIQVPDSNVSTGWHGGLGVPTTYNWVTYDNSAVLATTMLIYNFARKPPLFRLFFDPTGNAAAVTLRLNVESKMQ